MCILKHNTYVVVPNYFGLIQKYYISFYLESIMIISPATIWVVNKSIQ